MATTTDTRPRTWLHSDQAIRLGREIADLREELREVQERFAMAMREVRGLPGGQWLYDRVDAYPGLALGRDMGAGKDADGWLAEVDES